VYCAPSAAANAALGAQAAALMQQLASFSCMRAKGTGNRRPLLFRECKRMRIQKWTPSVSPTTSSAVGHDADSTAGKTRAAACS